MTTEVDEFPQLFTEDNGTTFSSAPSLSTLNHQVKQLNQNEILNELCRNLSDILYDRLKPKPSFDDSSNAYLYIVFVLMFYACSIIILMIKYIRRERESVKLEYYYDEFVKREAFQYHLFDKSGRILKLGAPPTNSSQQQLKQYQHHIERIQNSTISKQQMQSSAAKMSHNSDIANKKHKKLEPTQPLKECENPIIVSSSGAVDTNSVTVNIEPELPIAVTETCV